MAVENDFLPFAVGGSANVLTQAEYVTLTSLLQNGFSSGIATSTQLNKVWRQSSIMAAVLAQFIVARTGQTAIDDGTTATLLANLELSAAALNGDSTQTFSVAPATASQHAMQLGQQGHGQCRLSVASTTSLVLKPYNGNNVIVNGAPLQLPSAGVSIANTGLTASTVYYVYLAGTTASPSLVLSTTTHVTGSNGVEVMSGDATKTLVGMIATNASTQFASSTAQIFCLNWFNRRKLLGNEVIGSATTTSTGATELSTALRISFLCWADDIPQQFAYGNISNSLASVATVVAGYIDSSQAGISQSYASTTANFGAPFSLSSPVSLTEGLHLATMYGSVASASTGTYSINHTIMVNG